MSDYSDSYQAAMFAIAKADEAQQGQQALMDARNPYGQKRVYRKRR